MLGYIIAIISGALMSVQGVFNTGVTQKAGIWVTSMFVQFSALLVCFIAWLITGKEGSIAELIHFEKKYMLLGGAIGALITYTVIKAVEQLQPAKAIMFIVISQLVIAYVIELLGLFGADKTEFSLRRVLGLAITVAGIIIFKYEK